MASRPSSYPRSHVKYPVRISESTTNNKFAPAPAEAKVPSQQSEKKSSDNLCKDGIVALTYATHGGKDDRFCRAVASAIQHRVPLRILGWGEKWRGLTQKLEGSLEALRVLDEGCIVVFTDAYDVLYSDNLAGIKEKFESMGEPVLFAGECGCWPQITRDKGRGKVCLVDYPKSPTPYKYLNSGQWIAKKERALEIMEALMSEAKFYAEKYNVPVSKINDQEMVSDMYMNGRFGIELDHRNNIFQAMHATHARPLEECDPWPEMVNRDGVWENEKYGTKPSIFHFNGGGKIHHLEMERRMWYKSGVVNVKFDKILARDELMESTLIAGDGKGQATAFKTLCPSF